MKKRWLLLISFLLVVGGFVYWLMPTSQPAYQGKRLEAWLNDLVATNDNPQAIAAVRAIGTNAIPYLLEAIATPYNEKSARFYDECNLRLHLRWNFVKKPIYYPANIRFLGAVRGFSELGYSASNAGPQLGLLLNDPKRGMGAVHALVSIGPSAFPILTEASTNGSPMVRYHALNGFVAFGPQAMSALTVVTNYLNDTNQIHGLPISLHAMRALKRMDPLFDPNVAAP